MKKYLVILMSLLIILSSCTEYTVAEGIGIYTPGKDDSSSLIAKIPEKYSLEFLVETADVIARVVLEDITHVEVIMEEKDALGKRGIFGFVMFTDVYYSWTVNESAGRDSNVYIDYTPDYTNVIDPGFEEGEEYIVFLKRISPEMPFVYHNFYDYYMLTDYVTYKLEATSENEELVKKLINEYK